MERNYAIFKKSNSIYSRLFLLIFFTLISAYVSAQKRFGQCIFDQVHKEMLANDPQYRTNIAAMEARVLAFKENNKFSTKRTEGAPISIPVVVHVIHIGEAVGVGYNISDAQIQAAVAALPLNLINGDGVKFVLAKRDPSCGATNGINRINFGANATYVANGITGAGVADLVVKDLSRWSNQDYYNIWVVNRIDGKDGTMGSFTAGYAYFPGGSAALDGTVILATQMTSTSSTLAHELGHGLGLHHTFEGDGGAMCPANGNCAVDGDKVCDTEPHINPNSTCPAGTNTCTGVNFNASVLNNLMNYSTCIPTNLITAGQSARANTILATERGSLITSQGDELPPATSPTAPSCTFAATNGLGGAFGIEIFSLGAAGSIFNSNSSSSAGDGYNYKDNSCLQQATLNAGTTHPVSVKTWFTNPQDVRIFIDFNNDGDFVDAGETVFSSNNTVGTHTGTISIPASPLLPNIPLRMRVIADANGGIVNPCQITGSAGVGIGAGQAEDYTITIAGGTPPTINTPTSAAITTNTATLGATVASDGGSAITERGIVWSVTSTNNDPLIAGTGVTKVAEGGTAVSLFTKSVTGLPASTNISFKGYATNAGGTAYTTVATFTTLASANPNITVSSAEARNGAYNNITITSTGVMTLDGNISVDGTLIIQSGGKLLNPSCFIISGGGSFQLLSGGTMDVCSLVGITASGATGDVQVSGTRTFPTDATYIYKGTAAQLTGNGLPSQVQNLTIDNTNGVTLSQNTGIKRLLTLTNGNLVSDDLVFNGRLTLLSDASGTAMVIQKADGTNQVMGDVTVQRHITGGLAVYPGAYSGPGGYHYFSSPISTNNTVSQVADNISLALNSSYDFVNTYSGAFPNFYFYDENRVQAVAPNDAFEKGWYSPANTAATLPPMRGFIINVGTGGSLDFTGNLNNGDLGTGATPLKLSMGGSVANAGWHLLGNPYPAPISWAALKVLNPNTQIQAEGLRRIPTGQYAGTWAYFINGMGTNGGTDEIAMGQGFFVRAVVNNADFKINNSVRLTTYQNPTFFRTEESADIKKNGMIKLAISQDKYTDEAAIYFEEGASQSYDIDYDAEKSRFNSSPVPSIYTVSEDSKNLAINGLPAFSEEFTIPLTVYSYNRGSHKISLNEINHFKQYLQVFLEDKQLDVLHNLTQKPEYQFNVSNIGFQKDRFVIRFSNSTTASGDLDFFTIFPNPSNGEAKLRMFSNYKGEVAVNVYDLLGRVHKTLTIDKNANMFETNLDLQSLISGVYVVEIIDANGKKIRKINKF